MPPPPPAKAELLSLRRAREPGSLPTTKLLPLFWTLPILLWELISESVKIHMQHSGPQVTMCFTRRGHLLTSFTDTTSFPSQALGTPSAALRWLVPLPVWFLSLGATRPALFLLICRYSAPPRSISRLSGRGSPFLSTGSWTDTLHCRGPRLLDHPPPGPHHRCCWPVPTPTQSNLSPSCAPLSGCQLVLCGAGACGRSLISAPIGSGGQGQVHALAQRGQQPGRSGCRLRVTGRTDPHLAFAR